jgi:hypothetical protein
MAKSNEQVAAQTDAPAESAAQAADTGMARIQAQPPIKGVKQRFEDGAYAWESDGFTPAVSEVGRPWWTEHGARLRRDAGWKFSEVTED